VLPPENIGCFDAYLVSVKTAGIKNLTQNTRRRHEEA
jgi:hypothetical protein